MKPSIQFLEKIVKDPQKIFDKYINRELNRRKGKRPINAYFKETKEGDGISCFDEINFIAKKQKNKPTIT